MKHYRKKNIQPMEPWTPETNMSLVSISEADRNSGSPKVGDMIAVNPNDATDKWLIAQKFFEDNYEEVGKTRPQRRKDESECNSRP